MSKTPEQFQPSHESKEREKKVLSQELAELVENKVKNPAELSPEQREAFIKGVLYRAALEGKTEFLHWLAHGKEYRYKLNYRTKEESPATGPDERDITNGYGDEMVLMGYGKQLYDFLESQGLHLYIARGCDDDEKGTTFPDFIKAKWGEGADKY